MLYHVPASPGSKSWLGFLVGVLSAEILRKTSKKHTILSFTIANPRRQSFCEISFDVSCLRFFSSGDNPNVPVLCTVTVDNAVPCARIARQQVLARLLGGCAVRGDST